MKKKLLATILSVALTASMLAGCCSSAGTGGAATGDAAPEAVTTVGDPNGTHMEM